MKILLMLVLFFGITLASAQENKSDSPCGVAEGIALVYDQGEFQGRFAVLALHDGEYDYYVINQAQMAERFERIYFLNLAYSENKVISIDQAIDKDQLWFKACHQFQEQEVIVALEEMKTKAQEAFLSMPDAEKSGWLKKYDKFEKNNINE